MNRSGQSLIEFIIILAVLVVVAIFVLSVLGSNINDLFIRNYDQFKKYKPFDYSTSQASTLKSSSGNNSIPEGGENFNVNGVDVYIAQDGTTTFNVNGQDVILPSSVYDNINTVLEATGSSGVETLVNMVSRIIKDHQDEYAPEKVPVDIMFGKSVRTMVNEDSNYGDAAMNLVTVMVGDSYIILSKDQVSANANKELGTFILEGKVGDSQVDIKDTNYQSVSADIFEKGLNNVVFYKDPTTGNIYYGGDSGNSACHIDSQALSLSGISPPQGFMDENWRMFSEGKLIDQVWLFEFQNDTKQSL